MLGCSGSDRLSTCPLDKVGWLLIGNYISGEKDRKSEALFYPFDNPTSVVTATSPSQLNIPTILYPIPGFFMKDFVLLNYDL